MERWEYAVRRESNRTEEWKLAEMLDRMGDDGWELIQVSTHPNSGELGYIFKRKLARPASHG